MPDKHATAQGFLTPNGVRYKVAQVRPTRVHLTTQAGTRVAAALVTPRSAASAFEDFSDRPAMPKTQERYQVFIDIHPGNLDLSVDSRGAQLPLIVDNKWGGEWCDCRLIEPDSIRGTAFFI